MGGGNKQTSESRQQQQTQFGSLNPGAAVLGSLFGLGSEVNPSGGLGFSGGQTFTGGGGVFGQGAFDDIAQLAQQISTPRFSQSELSGLTQGSLDLLGEAQETGLVDPAVELSRLLFEQEFLPSAAEQFGTGFGVGPEDSDFQAAVVREASRRAAELGNLAQDRRLQAAQAVPGGVADALGLEGLFQSAERAASAGGQDLDLLGALSALVTQGQTGTTGTGRSDSKSAGGNLIF
jgi:hypothetical protein